MNLVRSRAGRLHLASAQISRSLLLSYLCSSNLAHACDLGKLLNTTTIHHRTHCYPLTTDQNGRVKINGERQDWKRWEAQSATTNKKQDLEFVDAESTDSSTKDLQ